MARVALLVLATCPIAALGVAGHGGGTPAPLSTTVIVGGDRDYPPFQFLDDRGEAHGFDVQLIRAVLEPQGMSVRFELGDWDSALERLKHGEIDVVPMFASSDRAKHFLFSKPYMLRYHVVFGHRDSPFVQSLQELSGQRVAVQDAGLAFEALSELPPGAVEIPGRRGSGCAGGGETRRSRLRSGPDRDRAVCDRTR